MLYALFSGGSFAEIVLQLFASVIVVLVVLPFHELAHGFVAYKLGDNTAKRSGRITLNPLAHLDPIGALSLILIGFGWANPVPVNPRNLKNPKRDMAVVALAGPVSNLLAALVGALLFNLLALVFGVGRIFAYIAVFLNYYIQVNIGLAVFNLIPLPPLDGSKVLGAFLSDRNYVKMMVYERQFSMLLLLLIVTQIIDKIVMFPRIWLTNLIDFIASLPFIPFT